MEKQKEQELYKLEIKKPVEYDGVTYTSLEFDFDALTGDDALNIDEELASLGKSAPVAAFSTEYLIRMAARACTSPIGADFFRKLSIVQFEQIKNKARSFLLSAGSET